MRILFGKKWKDGFLDYHRSPAECRLEVLAWDTLERLENVYHVRPKSLRLLLNYFPVVGPSGMIWKIWSRLREHYRNQKFVSCGIGRVLEPAENGIHKKGGLVAFVAPLHPALAERVVLPEELVFELDRTDLPEFPEAAILYHREPAPPEEGWWHDIRGWSMLSELPISPELQEKLAAGALKTLKDIDWNTAQRFPVADKTEPAETHGNPPPARRGQKIGALFGYGNYAKINIIPYSKPYIHIGAVHEIDPTQIFWEGRVDRWDTAPYPRPDEKYDVYFIASYNHTHVPIALRALEQGAHVVMEKPIASTYEQLDQLMAALGNSKDSQIFIGFQKRYSRFNDLARRDLRVQPGDPISYHCIVHEIIQPEFFWYNWPVSGSRLFSNGCHHVDHFLYLNDWSEPRDIGLTLAGDGTIDVCIELQNGAFFTMVFSEKGSSRVGPRDHIELKTYGRNVKATDATRYFSEHEHSIIRERRVYKTESYRNMYQTISRKIARGEPGDSHRSVEVSARTMLILEDKLQETLRKKGLSAS